MLRCLLGILVGHLGHGGRLVGGVQDAVVDRLEHVHAVRRLREHGAVVVHCCLRDVSLTVHEGCGTVRLHQHLGAVRHVGLERSVDQALGDLGAAVREGDGRLAGYRVGLGDHALRVGDHDAAVRVLTADVVAAVRRGVGGRSGGRVVPLDTPVGHVLLDRAVVQRRGHRLVAVRGDLDLPTPILGLHDRGAVGHQGDLGAVIGFDRLAAVAPGVGELLGTVGVLDRHRAIAHLGDLRTVLLDERLVASPVRIHPLERAVRSGHLNEAVRPTGH